MSDSLPQMIFSATADGTTTRLNTRWYEYTGLPPGSVEASTYIGVIHPDDRDGIFSNYTESLKTGTPWSYEYRVRRADGVYRWHLGRSLPTKDETGKILSWAGTVTDIHDQKIASAALEALNQNLENNVRDRTRELTQSYNFVESVLDNVPNMIFVKDAETLRFLRFNQAGENLIGISRQELVGKSDKDLFPIEQAEAFREADMRVLAGRVTVDIPEEPISTVHKGVRILHTKKIPVYDENGKPRFLVGISEDITDIKKFENERLQLIQERIVRQEAEKTTERMNFLAEASRLVSSSLDFDKILRNLGAAAVPAIADWCSVRILENDGVLRPISISHARSEGFSRAAESLARFGVRADSSYGISYVMKTGQTEFIPVVTDDYLKAVTVSEEHLEATRRMNLRSMIRVPIKVRGEVIGTLTFAMGDESGRTYNHFDVQLAEDIAIRAAMAIDNARLYREAQGLNRIKDEFLATLSHELRTPINVIQGHSELLLADFDRLSDVEIRESVEAIRRNARLQTQIVSDLLDVSSIVTGKMAFQPQVISPATIAKEVASAVEQMASGKGIRVSADVTAAPERLSADPTRVHQVLWNLLQNAVKFTPANGEIRLKVSQDVDACIFEISDTGIGIEPAFLMHVFERFRQADSSMSRKFGGLGLGLSIVKSLVEAHGGSVQVASEGLGKGAVFTVRLPLKMNPEIHVDAAVMKPTSLAEAPLLAAVTPPDAKLKGLQILLVEDSVDNRVLIKRLLGRVGAYVLETDSAATAREMLITQKPDLILSDIGMPGEDGLGFMRWLRNEAPQAARSIPAIALTAYVRPQEIEAVHGAGFQAHIAKPVTRDALIEEILKTLKLPG